MALTLDFNYTITGIGTAIVVTDDTVYGEDGNPAREDCLVNFIVTNMRTGEEIEITYDETTVTTISIPVAADGWYRVQATVENDDDYEGDAFSDEQYIGILVTARFCDCLATYTNKLTEKVCGCEDSKVWEKLFCLKGQLIGVETLVSRNDMLSADMAIERLNIECQRLNSDCGC